VSANKITVRGFECDLQCLLRRKW